MGLERMSRLGLCVLLIGARSAAASAPALNTSCDASLATKTARSAFLAFDQELRSALSTGDRVAMSLLVAYPLHVGYLDGSSTSLNNPRAVQVLFDRVFSPKVRSDILGHPPLDIACMPSGIMYNDGQLWAHACGDGTRFRITSV